MLTLNFKFNHIFNAAKQHFQVLNLVDVELDDEIPDSDFFSSTDLSRKQVSSATWIFLVERQVLIQTYKPVEYLGNAAYIHT